jgi:phage terminase small subunit
MEGSTLGLFRMTGPLHGFRGRIWFSSPKLDDTYFRINVQKTNCQIVEPKLLNWVKGLTMDYVKNKTKKIYDSNKKTTAVVTPPVVAQPEVETEPSIHSVLMTTKNTLYSRILSTNPDELTPVQALIELGALKQIALG